MAKPSENDENDVLASKVYDLLHTDRILDDLFWEMMLDIKEKKSYKHVVQMVDDLIFKHNNVLTSSFEGIKLQRTAVISEICLLAYTIDSVLPNLLFSKLRDEFPSIIKNIVEELKHEKKIDKNILPPKTNGDIVKSIPSVSNLPPANTLKKDTVTPTKSLPVKSISETSTPIKSIPKTSPAPVKNPTKKTSTKKNNVPTKSHSNNSKNLKTNNTKDKKVSKKEEKAVENDGDAESIGLLSLTSVSSVHTSELSSFDDEISLSSDEEENGKKRKKLSLGEIQHMYQNDRISAWCAENLNGTRHIKSSQSAKVNNNAKELKSKPRLRDAVIKSSLKEIETKSTKEIETKSSLRAVKYDSISEEVENNKQQTEESSSSNPVENNKEEIKDSAPEDTAASSSSTLIQPSSPQKTLPPRIRKPNSKYLSESILCPITLKQQKRAQQSDTTNNKTTEPSLHFPQKRKKIDLEESNENLEIKHPNKGENKSDEKDVEPSLKSSKIQNSSDLYKPYSSVRLLAARRTAPVTLFSTATQNLTKS